jgi:hypothetical protein
MNKQVLIYDTQGRILRLDLQQIKYLSII